MAILATNNNTLPQTPPAIAQPATAPDAAPVKDQHFVDTSNAMSDYMLEQQRNQKIASVFGDVNSSDYMSAASAKLNPAGVKELQSILKTAGYLQEKPNGIYDAATIAAITAVQMTVDPYEAYRCPGALREPILAQFLQLQDMKDAQKGKPDGAWSGASAVDTSQSNDPREIVKGIQIALNRALNLQGSDHIKVDGEFKVGDKTEQAYKTWVDKENEWRKDKGLDPLPTPTETVDAQGHAVFSIDTKGFAALTKSFHALMRQPNYAQTIDYAVMRPYLAGELTLTPGAQAPAAKLLNSILSKIDPSNTDLAKSGDKVTVATVDEVRRVMEKEKGAPIAPSTSPVIGSDEFAAVLRASNTQPQQ